MAKTATKKTEVVAIKKPWAIRVLFTLFFISGFNALLYQVAWQRMLGLFSGSDVRSVTVVIASYLLGLGLGNLLSSRISDRLNNRQCVRIYGCCNLGIAVFAICSRFLFYDLLFLRLQYLAQSPVVMLGIVFVSLLIPTTMMGLSLPLLSKAVSRSAENAASRIGWLYGINTLGSGVGTLVSGWYIVGTLGYAGTVYLGSFFSACVGLVALIISRNFARHKASFPQDNTFANSLPHTTSNSLQQWYLLVFLSGFAAISWEIIWFRVLDIALQSNAYTYAHLLAFILVSNGLGSLLGAKVNQYIRQPKKVFLLIQGMVAVYSAIAIWIIATYWQNNPDLRSDIGFIDLDNINFSLIFKYLIVPSVMMILPNLLLGFYFPIVQKAVQKDQHSIGKRVGSILVANILGNTVGSLVTGLVLLDRWGTSGSIKLLCGFGLGFLLLIYPRSLKAKLNIALTVVSVMLVLAFPSNSQLWAALQAVHPDAYFTVAEDSTSVAAIAESEGQGVLLASGQVQAHFPYMHLHGLLGTIPALLHPNPTDIMIIGLGSGGTPHTLGVNPVTERVKVVELLGAELTVLNEYAQTPIGKPLKHLLQDPRYEIVVGDGRRELVLAQEKFDIIEADAIQPWRSRAGMLYSQEFFQEVRNKLKPEGFFAQWNVGAGTRKTMLSVFPFVTNVKLTEDLSILFGSDRPIDFERTRLLTRLDLPQVQDFLDKAEIKLSRIRDDIRTAQVTMYSQAKDSKPSKINTDLLPRGEYYLNNSK
ncbi:Spermidine synthase [Hyella patelloides LEGE 07179]|uniref:Spermidine synthase n=1 Tax=Hyella patelloides LEGE 07179 TaxID=945734 RepID=A0A563VS12_9CYAN|nr:fused MFS/spermidine synthase [Hyella patelloides]VEP14196.1 Spermidine synthase [Hyella patelloides LEGE 07179]